jgi:serine/threonine protein kinase
LSLSQKVDPELIFTKQERIGKGSFGEVFKGVDNRTQQVSRLYNDSTGQHKHEVGVNEFLSIVLGCCHQNNRFRRSRR